MQRPPPPPRWSQICTPQYIAQRCNTCSCVSLCAYVFALGLVLLISATASKAQQHRRDYVAKGRWASYFANVNSKLASLALDLDLRGQAPIKDKTQLLWVWVYLRSPRPDGLSDNSEFDTLAAIEDGLAQALGSACNAVQAGRITSDGHREFYFYGADSIKFDASVSLVMKDFLQYKYSSGNQDDSQWKQYLNVLYPSEEDFERIKNGDVLVTMMKHGDTLEAVRDVHHWIYFHTLAQRQFYALKVKELGYSIEAESEDHGQSHPFGLQITRDQGVTPAQIDSAVIELFRLAKQVDADYDGWEAKVVASPKK
jgi:regulator of RNase E activity RraB